MHRLKRTLQAILISPLFFISFITFAANAPMHSSGPFDMAIANEQKLITMLKKSGKISPDAGLAEAEKTLQEYLQNRQAASLITAQGGPGSGFGSPQYSRHSFKHQRPGQNRHNRSGRHGGHRPDAIKFEQYDGEVKTARILSILVEFPDFPHNSVSPEDTDMYYQDYTREHYENLLYAKPTFAGPNGEALISVVSYYEAQSGGSYSIEGTVAGWYMMSNDAAYYGANDEFGNDSNPQQLVYEALLAVDADPSINLADFDIEDRFDLDGDGDYWEPDGLVDHVQVFHSSIGEEAGGGQLAEAAIWSHRFDLGEVVVFPNSPTDVPYWDGFMGAYDYTIQPIDAAAGVVAHEYGHDLGLPDEYDTQYSGRGEPVGVWSIMSTGSYGGLIPGAEPTGFSPWSKQFLQASLGGNWLTGEVLNLESLPWHGETLLLDRASSKGTNNDVIRIDLPDKKNIIVEPVSGETVYFSGSGDNLFNIMTIEVDLSAATTASLQFKAFYNIEQDWDYAFVLVNGEGIEGNITTTENPFEQNYFVHGITGSSEGWVDAVFDLSAYAGTSITLQFAYVTDAFVANPGFYIDDFSVVADGENILFDDAESEPLFVLEGFTQDTGYILAPHYYLLEWRTHHGVDTGLKNYFVAGQRLAHNEGLVIWYADDYYTDNWVGLHPGDGFVGVVDADQRTLFWSDGVAASTRYQIHDAAFSFERSDKVDITLEELDGIRLLDYFTRPFWKFKDTTDYSNPDLPDAGRNLTPYGLEIKLLSQSRDGSVIKLHVGQNRWYRIDDHGWDGKWGGRF